MKIGDLAKSTGIATSAIRFYETSGLLPEPGRKNGIRTYDAQAIDRVRTLRFFRAMGVSVRDLQSMFSAGGIGSPQSAAVVKQRIAELDDAIEHACTMRSNLHRLLACKCGGDRQGCVIFEAERLR